MAEQQVLLEAQGITKQFPGTLALDNVHLTVERGEIHAVMGENGAGKSTLMKVLSGVHQPDAGTIILEGRHIAPGNPRDALMLGISIVHQELSVVPALTVAENIYPGRLPVNALGMVRYGELFNRAADVLQTLDMNVDVRDPVSELSIANQQLVEIAKALSSNCKLLILDEPTSALTEREVEILFALLRKLTATGVGIVYISHKLDEVFKLTNRITVLRDGKYIGTVNTPETTPADVVRMMVGRPLEALYPPKAKQIDAPILEVQSLQLTPHSPANSFTLHKGEVLGIAGLIGSGRTEMARAIFGADAKHTGTISLNGHVLSIHSPTDAIRLGIGYLPEDRKAAGLFLSMAITTNVEAASLPEVTSGGFLNSSKERLLAEKYVRQLDISTPSIEQEVRRLSGGNQQKTLVAKWLAIQPKVLIVDEPTRGVDVGAKSEIHHLLRTLAEQGVGVIMISSELPEVIGMSDRILVMHEGAIAGEVLAAEATEETIIRIASGQDNTHKRKASALE
ncbi:MAG: sugar ABC transporter ATP-binding protein [Anaerolineae bacterium]|nr:sugar ABC transporter ATP-binding protein [Anaerolineae bacterium]